MLHPLPTRFSAEELNAIDDLVAGGVGRNRSEVVRQALAHYVDTMRRAKTGEMIAASYRRVPQTPEDDVMAMANAIAMTEAEPW